MTAILSDHNVEGQLDVLLHVWTSPDWLELWELLHCPVESFATLGLADDVPDSDLWSMCQDRGMILVTGNRNAEGENSLEATMRRLNRADSLLVLTIADPDRVMRDRFYAERVAVTILEILMDLDRYYGTRRVYVP